jgi:L-threonylcarbamoyladenylate synthase
MDVNSLVNILNNSGIAVIPTDTVYGLVGDATNENVIKKIFLIKQRENSKPLLILISNFDMLKKYVKNISSLELGIINKFWPGPLTIIFQNKKNLSDVLTANKSEIAIRMPNDERLLDLINKLDKPIIATSANIAHKKTITSIDLLEDKIKNNVDYIYDGGFLEDNPSTIIKVIDNKVIIVRDGIISKDIKNYFDLN